MIYLHHFAVFEILGYIIKTVFDGVSLLDNKSFHI